MFADTHLRRHDQVWAAGGTPDTVFPIALNTLIEISGAEWAEISEPFPT